LEVDPQAGADCHRHALMRFDKTDGAYPVSGHICQWARLDLPKSWWNMTDC